MCGHNSHTNSCSEPELGADPVISGTKPPQNSRGSGGSSQGHKSPRVSPPRAKPRWRRARSSFNLTFVQPCEPPRAQNGIFWGEKVLLWGFLVGSTAGMFYG